MGDFSLGRDISLDIVDGDGSILRFPIRTGFTSKPKYHEIDSVGLDGINRHEDVPLGWDGTLTLDRADSSVDDYFAQDEANWYAGLNRLKKTITETIQERDGSISQYRYINVKLHLNEAGNWSGDNRTSYQLGFTAERKVKVA